MRIYFRPCFNIAPTRKVLAVRQPGQGATREPVELRWGEEQLLSLNILGLGNLALVQ
jgi:hypothetical protein